MEVGIILVAVCVFVLYKALGVTQTLVDPRSTPAEVDAAGRTNNGVLLFLLAVAVLAVLALGGTFSQGFDGGRTVSGVSGAWQDARSSAHWADDLGLRP